MKLLMRGFGGEDFAGGCELVLVHLDEDRVREILALRELFQMAKSKAPRLWKMALWDASVEFYDLVEEEEDEDDEDEDEDEDADEDERESRAPCSSLTGRQSEEFDSENYLVLPDDFEMGREPRRTECDQLCVTADGIFWTTIVKHTDVRVETAEVRYDVLLDVLASFEAKS